MTGTSTDGAWLGAEWGLANAGDPLRLLGLVLLDGGGSQQRRWMIDTQAVKEPVSLDALRCFVRRLQRSGQLLHDVAIAWVVSGGPSPAQDTILEQLPSHFRCFHETDEARPGCGFRSGAISAAKKRAADSGSSKLLGGRVAHDAAGSGSCLKGGGFFDRVVVQMLY